MRTLIQESQQSCNPLSMLIACSFCSEGVYRPLNGTERLTKDSQHAPHPLSFSLSISYLDRLLHTHTTVLSEDAESEKIAKCVNPKQLFVLRCVRVQTGFLTTTLLVVK